MSNAVVSKVVEVKDHPNADKAHLGIFILDTGAQLIGVNNEDGSRRFRVDDLLIHVKPGAIIPEKIVNSGFENVKGGKIKASNFAGVRSEGIMLNLLDDPNDDGTCEFWYVDPHILSSYQEPPRVHLGDDVTELLGITS